MAPHNVEQIRQMVEQKYRMMKQSTLKLAHEKHDELKMIGVGVGSIALFIIASRIHRVAFKRIVSTDYVSAQHIARKRVVYGRVVHVGDSDNFRIVHMPPMSRMWWNTWWSLSLKSREAIAESIKRRMAAKGGKKPANMSSYTIHIRIAGCDAPEDAHFGQKGQPMAKEVKQWLTNELLGREVRVQFLRRDQYARVVGSVALKRHFLLGWLFPRDLTQIMVSKGFAVVYEGAGSVYGESNTKESLMKLQERARKKRLGMWKARKVETPRDYKRRIKAE